MDPLDRWLSLLPYIGSLIAGWLMYRAARKQTSATSESDFRAALIEQNKELMTQIDKLTSGQASDHAEIRKLTYVIEGVQAENKKLTFQLQLAIVWGQTADGLPPRSIPDWLMGPRETA